MSLLVGLLLVGIWWYQGHHRGAPPGSNLVLHRSDLRDYKVKASDTGKQGALPGLLSRYSVLYALKDATQLGNSPLAIASSVSIFKTAPAAHAAFRHDSRVLPKTPLAPPALGSETIFFVSDRGKSSWLVWRSGRVLATLTTIGVEPGRRLDTVRFGELMQSRIARAG